MKLELKHLAPYLPFKLKVQHHVDKRVYEMICGHIFGTEQSDYSEWQINGVLNGGGKPILRPLSDLTKEIEHNGERFVPVDVIENHFGTNRNWYRWESTSKGITNCLNLEYKFVQLFFEWHFDVFGLIEKGLAIDINTIK